MQAAIITFLVLLFAGHAASAAIFEVKAKCKGTWDFAVDLTQDGAIVGTAADVCTKKTTVEIDTGTAVPNDVNITVTSDITTCTTAVPAQVDPIEEAKFECSLKVSDGPRESIKIQVEEEEADDDDD